MNALFAPTIVTWFEEIVILHGASVAVVCEDRSWTYDELNQLANAVAHKLQTLGVRPGDLVGLCMRRDLPLISSILGILKVGAAYAPLDPTYPAERLRFLIEDSGCGVVICDEAHRGILPSNRSTLLVVDTIPLAEPTLGNLELEIASDSLAYVIYTSGSTGLPKGVQVSHHNVVRLFKQTDHWFGFGPHDIWTLFHSYAFDFSVWEIWGALLYGGKLVIVPYETSRSPEDFYRLLSRERVTVLNQTPSAFRQLVIVDERLSQSQSLALRYVVFGGEALEFSSLRPWVSRHGAQSPTLVNMYGITETTVHVTYRPLTAEDIANDSDSLIGVPIPDLQLYVLDESQQRVSPGVVGELFVGGEGVSQGYLKRPELTAERFLNDPFSSKPGSKLYKTGDLGLIREDGQLAYRGRSDRQVQLRGFRVELGEIESALQRVPSVSQAIVQVRRAADGEDRLAAYIVHSVSGGLNFLELRQRLQLELPSHMIPQYFVRIETIPLTAHGKLDSQALPDPFVSQSIASAAVGPKTPAEEIVANVWRGLLGLDQVSTQLSFFEHGGVSLQLAEMEQRLYGLFPRQFKVVDLFQYPTIETLAEYLSRLSTTPGEPVNSSQQVRQQMAARQQQMRSRSAFKKPS
jgi:amino acid adenylation domain-containing protein